MKPFPRNKRKLMKLQKAIRESISLIIATKGNMNIISKSKIKYNKPIIQYIISNFFLASPIGLNPFSYVDYFSLSPLFVINQKDKAYNIVIRPTTIIPIFNILLFLFFYLFLLMAFGFCVLYLFQTLY
jgi:hypothetical protein